MAASVLLTIGERPDLIDAIVRKARDVTAGSGPNQIGPVIDQASLLRIQTYISDAETKHGSTIALVYGPHVVCSPTSNPCTYQ